MPKTTLCSNYESVRQNLNCPNYQLKSYHKIKPNHHQYYTSIHTNEIFNILPELHRYTHITKLSIHILNTKQLENMENISKTKPLIKEIKMFTEQLYSIIL